MNGKNGTVVGGGNRSEEGVSIKGQSQCGTWSSEYRLGVHLADRPLSGV